VNLTNWKNRAIQYGGLENNDEHNNCNNKILLLSYFFKHVNHLSPSFPEGGVDLEPKSGCLLTSAYNAFRRYKFGERQWNYILTGKTIFTLLIQLKMYLQA
jgi:hypothetical protein